MSDTETATAPGAAEANGATGDGAGAAAAPPPPQQPPAPQPQPAAAGSSNQRGYGVFQKVVLDPNAENALEKLKELQIGEKPLYLLVRMAACQAAGPKAAVTAVGEARDLDGDYEAIADSSRNEFKNVKSETRRSVSIG